MKHKEQGNDVFSSFEGNPLAQRFIGRVQTLAEQFAHLVLGCSAEEFSTWLGAVLIRDSGSHPQLHVETMPSSGLRRPEPTAVDQRLREVALGSQPHRRGSRAARPAKAKVTGARRKAHPLSGKKANWWWTLSEKNRAAIIAKRKRTYAAMRRNRSYAEAA